MKTAGHCCRPLLRAFVAAWNLRCPLSVLTGLDIATAGPNLPNLAENFGVNRLGRKNWRTAAFAASIHFEMGLFSKKDDYNRMFSRNERVVAAYDLPGVPERTGGKVKMVNGFEWQRYWVFFDNGVQLGSLDGSALLRPHHWERWRGEREEVMAEMKARMEAAVA